MFRFAFGTVTAVALFTGALTASRPALARDPKLHGAAYLDPHRPVEQRVADLLRRMTLEEKVAQLVGTWRPRHNVLVDERGVFAPTSAREMLKNGLGVISRPSEHEDSRKNKGPRDMAVFANALQKYVLEQTRLGIPLLCHEEGLHGIQAPGGTSFPVPIALASSFDEALVEEVYTAVAREIRARGAHQALAPVVDVARDPRWGRTEETFGEDPYLASRMAVAAVRGFQGRGATLDGGIDREHVIATAKHFGVHGQPEGGINVGPGHEGERTIREVFLPPFHAALLEAHAWSVMPSYNETDGLPSHVNRWLLRKVLRDEWGWDGLVVSDYFAIEQLPTVHHVAADCAEAARRTLAAGVDVELPDAKCYPTVVDQVRRGLVDQKLVDEAVRRVLRVKIALGLFEDAYVDPDRAEALPRDEATRKLARRAAERSLVLLKNEGGLLPLDVRKLRSIAVIGPNSARCALGGYSGGPPYCVSVLQGVRERLGDRVKVTSALGAGITKGFDWFGDEVVPYTAAENTPLIKQAVEVARAADLVLLVLGDTEQTSREAWSATHLGDRADLELVGQQNELARAVLATGRPTVVLLLNGRPPSVNEIAARAPALLEGFYLGQEAGHAVAAVLFGDVAPGGKLPISVPRSAGHLPDFYDHKPSARRGYLFDDVTPLFPFGHGLSYTTFSYANLKVAPAKIDPTGTVTVTVDVTNKGKRDGDEVVQLYLRDVISSVTRPVKELKGFARVALKPGETRAVRFTLGPEALRFWNEDMKQVVEPGTFEVMVGGDSVHLTNASFEVEPPAKKPPKSR